MSAFAGMGCSVEDEAAGDKGLIRVLQLGRQRPDDVNALVLLH